MRSRCTVIYTPPAHAFVHSAQPAMPLPRYHAAATFALAGVVVAQSRRLSDALPILGAGILVDVDHLVDLAVARATGDVTRTRWIIVPLHAWEWVFALLFRRHRFARLLAGGLALHLVLDQSNHAIRHPLFYWIAVRARYGFRAEEPLLHSRRFQHARGWMSQSPTHWF